ncbi:hypothetical protein KC845_02640 [Candidatus Kaiserbacteria bacterium]|nr:hypothetical protein [Candidatus Kaiserbacteria bacterium]
MEQVKKPKIIYILGTGHSGSTLLELILSTSPESFSVGGFRYLDRYVHGSHGVVLDDSGYKAKESPMWSEIAKNKQEFIIKEPTEPTLSFKNRLKILFTGRPLVIPNRYNDFDLYKAVIEKSNEIENHEIDIIIDSSKTLARFIELNEDESLDVYVIHLIRDVRGVVNSNRKLGKNVYKSAKYWVTDNLYIKSYLKKSVREDRQMRIKYKDFVKEPEKYIEIINKKFDLNIDFNNYIDEINKQESYRFAGNGMRNKKFEGIKKDFKWKYELPLFYRIILTPIQWFFYKVLFR